MNTKTKSRPMRPASAKHRIVLMLTALLFAANAVVAQMTVSGTCGKTENDNVTWSYTTLANTNMLTIAGTGEMADFSLTSIENPVPWSDYKDDIKMVIIGENVTNIGDYAFYRYSNLASVLFANGSSLMRIGGGAFANCKNLTSIILPASVTCIDEGAFGESGLTNISFGDNSQLITIGAGAFSSCKLTSIKIPATVTSIGKLAFSRFYFETVSYIKSVTILASSLNTYGTEAFLYNTSELIIYVPKSSVDTYKAGWPDYADYIFPIPDDPTSIGNATVPSGNAQAADEAWYSLSGVKLNAKPTERGVYLHQGRKVVVK